MFSLSIPDIYEAAKFYVHYALRRKCPAFECCRGGTQDLVLGEIPSILALLLINTPSVTLTASYS
jgi:hypothetical protein